MEARQLKSVRQGDVCLIRIEKLPAGCIEAPPDGDAGGPASNWHNRPGRTVQPIGDDLVGGKWRWVA